VLIGNVFLNIQIESSHITQGDDLSEVPAVPSQNPHNTQAAGRRINTFFLLLYSRGSEDPLEVVFPKL
jgi:hypothetical protein